MWYYAKDGGQVGPVPFGTLQEKIQVGEIQPGDHVWCEGLTDWIMASEVEGLYAAPGEQVAYSGPAGVEPMMPAPQRVKRANFGLLMFLGVSAGIAIFLGAGMAAAGEESGNDSLVPLGGFICFMGAIIYIMAVVIGSIYIYRMWYMIQGPFARTNPGKAVGFLFIPLYSLYWIFVAFYGWAQDYNQFTQGYNMHNAPRMPEGLFLAMCILSVCSIIPMVGTIASVASVILCLVGFNYICKAINYMAGE